MNPRELCSMVDHTLLKQTATWEEIKDLVDEAIAYGTASVCIPPCYVAAAHEYAGGMLKAGEVEYVADEIRRLKAAVGDRVLKVIIETCLLTEAEKITMCRVVTDAGADFIKTSTGFSTGGATFEDIALFKKHVGPGVRIKAAGGISSLEAAERCVALGATRLGTSRIIKLLEAQRDKA